MDIASATNGISLTQSKTIGTFLPLTLSLLSYCLYRQGLDTGVRREGEKSYSRTREPDHVAPCPSKVLEGEGLRYEPHIPLASHMPRSGAVAGKEELVFESYVRLES